MIRLKSFIKKIIYRWNYRRYQVKCKKLGQKQFILFGTPKHGNIGDHAITLAIYQLFKDIKKDFFEVSSFDRTYLLKYLQKYISNEDIIMINGGGFMGSKWIEEEKMIRDVFIHFPNHKIIIFPQTIYYENTIKGKEEMKTSLEIYNSHKDLIICTREEKSYQFACQNLKDANIILMPDMVLYFDNFAFQQTRKNVLFCLRSDSEKSVTSTTIRKIEEIFVNRNQKIDTTDTVIKRCINKKQRMFIFRNKLLEFSKYEIIITDRLHGMIFAALTNTPCIVLSNYNYKVKGVYEWIKKTRYIRFIEDDNLLEPTIDELLSFQFTIDQRLCNKVLFEKLITILEERENG